jgi:hypothetical protein
MVSRYSHARGVQMRAVNAGYADVRICAMTSHKGIKTADIRDSDVAVLRWCAARRAVLTAIVCSRAASTIRSLRQHEGRTTCWLCRVLRGFVRHRWQSARRAFHAAFTQTASATSRSLDLPCSDQCFHSAMRAPFHFVRTAISVIVLSWIMYLGCAASPARAEALTTRDILNLDKFGKDISSISWCSDETLTLVDLQSADSTEGQASVKRSIRTVKMLSLSSGESRQLLVYLDAGITAHCVRGGEFLYISGTSRLAYQPSSSPSVGRVVYQNFYHLLEVPREGASAKHPTVINNQKDGALYGPVLTDANGNVYGRMLGGSQQVELKNINLKGLTSRQKSALTYKVSKDDFHFIILAVNFDSDDPRARRVGFYGLATPDGRSVGSYPCPGPRPGCAAGGAAKSTHYYTSSKFVASKVPRADGFLDTQDVLYTVVSGDSPAQPQRWPIVRATASKLPYQLAVVDVAIDAKRCLVLLEPNRWLASSRDAGRLRQDLLIADCTVKGGRLEYSEPQSIGFKQGSFIFPKLSIHGDIVAVTDTYSQTSQQDDQIELERQQDARAQICVKMYLGSSAEKFQRINSLCALVSQIDHSIADSLIVSPGAKFIAFGARGNPLIVGRDFRNDGRGPAWLTNGD